MASTLASSVGWYFLPSFVTGHVQSALYAIFIRAGDPKPAPGSPRFVRDRRRIQIAVIVAYLLYTIYEADYQLQKSGDFYRLLGVGHDVDERGVLSRFRRLTVQFHPDKATGPDRDAINDIYVQLQLARDTLADAGKRFTYDRFGPEMLTWAKPSATSQDVLIQGLQRIAAYYALSGGFLFLLSVVGYMRSGMFWRYVALAIMFVLELHAATRMAFPVWLSAFVNPICALTGLRPRYLPFQMVILLRKVVLTLMIAAAQLGPLLQDPRQAQLAAATANHPGGVDPQLVQRIDNLTQAADTEIVRLIAMEMMPFVNEDSSRQLNRGLKDWLATNAIRNDPEVKAVIAESIKKKDEAGELSEPPRNDKQGRR